MKLGIDGYGNSVEAIPQTGPLVVVANHPFGLVDGAAAAWLMAQRRLDFKVILWDVFEKSGSAENYLLTLDLTENSTSARKQNVRIRREANQHLSDGHAILIFPAGSVERTNWPLGRPNELQWSPFTEKIIDNTDASVLPLYFHGHNSRLFHIASNMSETLRQSLWFREIARRINTDVEVTIGSPINQTVLKRWSTNKEMTNRLFEATMALGKHDWTQQKRTLRARAPGPYDPIDRVVDTDIEEELIRT